MLGSKVTAQLCNLIRRVTSMQHCVTVWAYRNEIVERIESIRRLQPPERAWVMYVNEAFPDLTITSLEVQLQTAQHAP